MRQEIREELIKIFEYAKNNLFVVGLLGFLGFPLYYIVWKYLYPQPYENLTFRIICSIFVVPWIFYKRLPNFFIKIFPAYFFLTIFVCLPLFFTFMLFANSFSHVGQMSFLAAAYLTILLLYNWIFVVVMFLFAFVLTLIAIPAVNINPSFENLGFELIPILFFALASGILCHRTELKSQFKIRNMKSFGGGIAHEMRNPLNAINLLTARIRNLIIASDNTIKKQLNLSEIKEINSNLNTILGCTSRASEVIEMILANLKEKVKQKKLEFLSASDLVSSAVKEYGFDYEGQVDKIILDTKNNFVIKVDRAAFTYMIFNLIKNALYYLNSNKDGFIKISLNRGENGRLNYNQIIVEDNGPGIAEDKIKYIFDSFYTSGKEDGVGLGLDFCKKAMESFDGKIECNSKINDFTKFILSFPKLSDAEINKFLPNNEGVKFDYFSKNTLIFENVDFLEESNHFKNAMKELEINAKFFKEETVFISELKLSRNCELLLIDIENNEDIIFELIVRIRKINNEVPIIVYNANRLNEKELISAGVDEIIIKNQKQILLLERSIAKWSLINKVPDCFDSIIDKNSYPKRILLADDDSVNRIILSKNLQKYGFEIDEVFNGKELQDKLFDENLHYDLVITDVNMPIINGDEAIKSIINFKDNSRRIPIIIYSGDGEKENIHKFLKSGVSDYFVKGDDVKHLIDLARFWTS